MSACGCYKKKAKITISPSKNIIVQNVKIRRYECHVLSSRETWTKRSLNLSNENLSEINEYFSLIPLSGEQKFRGYNKDEVSSSWIRVSSLDKPQRICYTYALRRSLLTTRDSSWTYYAENALVDRSVCSRLQVTARK